MMHIQPLTRPLPAPAEAKDIERDIAFVSMIIEFVLLVQDAVSTFLKGE